MQPHLCRKYIFNCRASLIHSQVGWGWVASLAAHNWTTHQNLCCLCGFIMEAQRFPISVHIIGVMHKEKSKVSTDGVIFVMAKICAFLQRYKIWFFPPSDVHDLCAVVGSEWHYCLQNFSGFQENAREYKIPSNIWYMLHIVVFLITGVYLYISICYCRNKWRKHSQQQINWKSQTESFPNFEVSVGLFPATVCLISQNPVIGCYTFWLCVLFHLDKRMKPRDQRKGPTKSLLCLKFLQKYCDELLSCDPQVCQSADLIQFFHPKDQDLQPEFSKNGYAKHLFLTIVCRDARWEFTLTAPLFLTNKCEQTAAQM